MKKITTKNNNLIWWLIDDYACHLAGLGIQSKTSQTQKYIAKVDLLKRFKKLHPEILNYKPFQFINWEGSITANEAQDLIIKELQMILLSNENMLSLSKHYMSNEMAIEFTDFIFAFFLENELEMKPQINELYKNQQSEKYVYGCLMNKICAVCNRPEVDLDHWRTVAAEFGTYEKDDGTGSYISLCRIHHREKHDIGPVKFKEKYNVTGIRLSEKQIPEIKKKYPNHFKAFKSDLNQ